MYTEHYNSSIVKQEQKTQRRKEALKSNKGYSEFEPLHEAAFSMSKTYTKSQMYVNPNWYRNSLQQSWAQGKN